jgi:hypothetical protein
MTFAIFTLNKRLFIFLGQVCPNARRLEGTVLLQGDLLIFLYFTFYLFNLEIMLQVSSFYISGSKCSVDSLECSVDSSLSG